MRASDADRDRALAQLQDALVSGMIDPEEFHDRSGQALQARTRRELAAITSDLPVSDALATPATQDSVVELRGTSSSLERTGRWIVPRRLVLHQQKGSAELDFTQAQISHPVTGIELDVRGARWRSGCPTAQAPQLTASRPSAAASKTTATIPCPPGTALRDHRHDPTWIARTARATTPAVPQTVITHSFTHPRPTNLRWHPPLVPAVTLTPLQLEVGRATSG